MFAKAGMKKEKDKLNISGVCLRAPRTQFQSLTGRQAQSTSETVPKLPPQHLLGHLGDLQILWLFFGTFPSTNCRNKHNLVCWIPQSSLTTVLGQLLMFMANAQVENALKCPCAKDSSNDNEWDASSTLHSPPLPVGVL